MLRFQSDYFFHWHIRTRNLYGQNIFYLKYLNVRDQQTVPVLHLVLICYFHWLADIALFRCLRRQYRGLQDCLVID